MPKIENASLVARKQSKIFEETRPGITKKIHYEIYTTRITQTLETCIERKQTQSHQIIL